MKAKAKQKKTQRNSQKQKGEWVRIYPLDEIRLVGLGPRATIW